MIKIIFEVSDAIINGRKVSDVMLAVVEEVGELSTELAIHNGRKNRNPSEDGIVGEAIDAIICLLDLIRIHDPNITDEEIKAFTEKKCLKWLNKSK
jgi:hypothetical protein